MSKVDTSQFQGHLMGQIIAAVVGSILLIFEDFAGYYVGGYSVRTWAYINLGSVIPAFFILIGIGGLVFALYYAVQSLQAKDDMSPMTLLENTRRSMMGGAFTAALAGVGALVFILTSLDTDDWWLDTGFYGAFFGGLLIAVFAKLMLDKIEV